ncbi:trypsin-like serine protease [Melghirimyces profundicolus]|uniref:trypsin-like serine protease n=1 Tax=Melghirimyces profundicolus TaxID=1242148 RepID=UPI000D38D059|nr:trypsin-like serine protease [Melghirimyces profundicolus]
MRSGQCLHLCRTAAGAASGKCRRSLFHNTTNVFLAAAHCTSDLGDETVWVSFDSDVDPVTTTTELYSGKAVTHPDYNQRQSNPADLAVVLLDQPIKKIQPAQLPEAGLFDRMGDHDGMKGQPFTAVGYGVHAPVNQPGGPTFPYDGERWKSVSQFEALNDSWLRLSQNDATGDGGTCYGDSGGPNFLGSGPEETDIIAGVTVTGDAMCKSTNTIYRLDIPTAREFLSQFVELP